MALIATSPTIKGLEKMANAYFYSTSITIGEDLSIRNSKGSLNSFKVINKKGRYRLESI